MLGLGHFPPGSVVDPYVPDLLSNMENREIEASILEKITKLILKNIDNNFLRTRITQLTYDSSFNFKESHHLDQDDTYPQSW